MGEYRGVGGRPLSGAFTSLYPSPAESPARLLVVEDDPDFSFAIGTLLRGAGHAPTIVDTLQGAEAAMLRETFDVALLDLSLPDGNSHESIARLLLLDPTCSVVVLTGSADAASAVRSLRAGACDYLTKPVSRPDLLGSVASARERSSIRRETAGHRASFTGTGGSGTGDMQVVGDSPPWMHALSLLRAAARAPRTTVLLTGEPGVGKEVAAAFIHSASARGGRPYVVANAACFDKNLLESELLGHEAGAFTGAARQKKGLVELAEGGTLFLDEIGELTLDLQAKLLRLLEGHPFRRVGGEREILPDARIICATNRDLQSLVDKGRFRADLYHRIKVLDIRLPPLRERGRDIERLALFFLAKLGGEMGITDPEIDPDTLGLLGDYGWPGNVRELRNVIERALVLSHGDVITRAHLPADLTGASPGLAMVVPVATEPRPAARRGLAPSIAPSLAPLADVVREHILAAYEQSDHNLTRCASVLGMSRVALRARLRGYGIKRDG